MTTGRNPEWREGCIKALCKCRHADLRHSWNFRGTIAKLVEFHKEAPGAFWDGNQCERLDLCRVAYRDQLPEEFAPDAPIRNWKGTRLVGESPVPRLAGQFVTWRGDYAPFATPYAQRYRKDAA